MVVGKIDSAVLKTDAGGSTTNSYVRWPSLIMVLLVFSASLMTYVEYGTRDRYPATTATSDLRRIKEQRDFADKTLLDRLQVEERRHMRHEDFAWHPAAGQAFGDLKARVAVLERFLPTGEEDLPGP